MTENGPNSDSLYSPAGSEDFPHQLHVYTGDNKGKTTAAVGLAVRALGAGLRATLIQFDKGYQGEEHYSERNILRTLPGLQLHPTGCERVRPGQKFRFGVNDEDRAEAQRGVDLARSAIEAAETNLLILDEILSAIRYKLVREEELLNLIALWEKNRPFDFVLTGRQASGAVIDRAGLVTDMTKVKHYFDEGIPARRGYDY